MTIPNCDPAQPSELLLFNSTLQRPHVPGSTSGSLGSRTASITCTTPLYDNKSVKITFTVFCCPITENVLSVTINCKGSLSKLVTIVPELISALSNAGDDPLKQSSSIS